MTSNAANVRYLVRGVSGLQQQVGDQGEGIETKPIDPALERGLQQKKEGYHSKHRLSVDKAKYSPPYWLHFFVRFCS